MPWPTRDLQLPHLKHDAIHRLVGRRRSVVRTALPFLIFSLSEDVVPQPSNDQLRSLAADITARPDYDLATRRAEVDWLFDLLIEVLSWLIAPLRWIYKLTEGLPEFFRWLIIAGMLVIVFALIAHIIYTIIQAVRGDRSGSRPSEGAQRRIEPDEWERRAAAAAAAGEYIAAVRYLFRAVLGRLEQADKKPLRPGTTNRELLRRYRARTEVVDGLRLFVDVIDRKWYGGEVCTASDYAECAAAHDGLRRAAEREEAHALGA